MTQKDQKKAIQQQLEMEAISMLRGIILAHQQGGVPTRVQIERGKQIMDELNLLKESR